MRLLWRWRKQVMNKPPEREIQESEQRLKETQKRWPEVHRVQRNLDQLIERALRGGSA